MKLLSISSDAKTVKGEGQGYLTAILYLSPERRAGGWNLCPRATEGCKVGCLYDAGRASVLKAIPRSRLAKTRFLMLNKGAFVAQLKAEISAFIKKSERLGLTPCVRLNGTSDIAWEKFAPEILALPVQFYDYTKRLERGAALPANYRLTYSRSEVNEAGCIAKLQSGHSVAVVFRTKALPLTWHGFRVVSGDESDLRFLDPAGVVIGLYAKGPAKLDSTGFVVD